MQYKFKVDVYRHNPYSGVLWTMAALIGLPAAFFLFQKTDSLSIPTSAPAPVASTPASVADVSLLTGEPVLTMVTDVPEPPETTAPETPIRPLVRRAPTGTCVFEGKALKEGEPYANAVIMARVATSSGERIRRTRTEADGSYRLEVPVRAKISDPVDWSLEARTEEQQPLILAGRRIFLGNTVAIEQTLAF